VILCDQRLNVLSSSRRVNETAEDIDLEIIEFASWFEITALPTNWRLDRLKRVLELVEFVDSTHFDLEALGKEATEHLRQVMHCLLLFSKKLPKEAYIGTGQNAAKSILKVGLRSSDAEIQQSAVRARDNLLLAGRFEFMELDSF